MRIVIERNIPFIRGVFEHVARVDYLAPEEFGPDTVRGADALIVRTRTRCDAALLEGSGVGIVATATIGTDHIDTDWCATHGVAVANAPGCNAPAVAQYVLASVHALSNRPLGQYTIGIVGAGHVGSIVARWARQLDMRVMLNDPPRQAAEGGDGWSSLDDIAREADIITFHTPLDDTTRHMAGRELMAALRRAPIIINAARGPVVDTPALTEALERGLAHKAVIDCWEGEPAIDRRLLQLADVATPHIAGYSLEGKMRATRMAVDAVCRHLGLEPLPVELPGMPGGAIPDGARVAVTARAIAASYSPLADTAALKARPEAFESLRDNYALRREVRAARID